MKKVGVYVEKISKKLNEVKNFLDVKMASLPNIPDDDLQPGGKENNKVIYQFSNQPKFDFKEKDHVELENDLNLIDYERGVKLAGQGSWIYTGVVLN